MSEIDDLRRRMAQMAEATEAAVTAVGLFSELMRHAVKVTTASALAAAEMLEAAERGDAVPPAVAAALRSSIADKLKAMEAFMDEQNGRP
jgi:hypothetical protein